MGRRKIEIKPIRDDRNRSVTFLKRKGGLFKKAHELSVLCSVDVAVVIFGHNKKLYEYSSSDINEIVGRFQYTIHTGGAHEHKGPTDFVDKSGGADDDDDDDAAGDEGGMGGSQRGTPAPEHAMMQPQMQNHPGFQHVRHGTPSGSPPMHNGAMPQVQRGPSPMPPGVSRPSSRADQQPGHRRTSSNLVPPHMQQSQGQPQPPNYAYTPNPPFYNPNVHVQMHRPAPQGHPGTYPPVYPPSYQAPYPPTLPPNHQHMQPGYMQDNRRASMPPAFPTQPAPPANMTHHSLQEHLQAPSHARAPNRSPQPQQRPTPSPQPAQHEFTSPPPPQPKSLPTHAKTHSIFTPIDDSRSMLAQHWNSSNPLEMPRSEPLVKLEGGARSASIDVATMQRGKGKGNSPRPPPGRGSLPGKMQKSPLQNQRSASSSGAPARGGGRSGTSQPDAKRPRLKVQIPSEQSGDEGEEASGQEDASTGQTASESHQPGPMVLPPPSPSAGALLSAGAQGPTNPFARPAPPMSTNPHAMRDSSHIETPISALPSRFMSDNLLPSPSTFYPEWGFGRSGDSNMLPSPLNFQTPVVPNVQGWREEDRKRAHDEEVTASEAKRSKS